MKTSFTILVDNVAQGDNTIAEHGFACLVQRGDTTVLFDTGQGRALSHNIETLGVPRPPYDRLVISHGHMDHTGGLIDMLARDVMPAEAVHIHAYAFDSHLRKENGEGFAPIGFGRTKDEVMSMANVVMNEDPLLIADGFLLSGTIPRKRPFDADEKLFAHIDGSVTKDPFRDEQFMVVDVGEGIAVLTGCTHAGLANVIEYAQSIAPNKPIQAVIGGFHLFRAAMDEIEATAKLLQEAGAAEVVSCHCTGFEGNMVLRHVLKDAFIPAHVGLTRTY